MEIIEVTKKNIEEYSPRCFIANDNPGMIKKLEWVQKRFKEGLKLKQIYDTRNQKISGQVETSSNSDKKLIGYIEYINGENAFRAVDAKNYLFIHCLWVSPNKYKNKGYASQLLKEVEKDMGNNLGVATITSDDGFMSSKDLFVKNGYEEIETKGKFQLMVKQIKKGQLPKLKNVDKELEKYKGLNIVYSSQCPWVARSINDIVDVIEKTRLNVKVKEMKTAKQAQLAPSIYSTFNLIYDGKLLADRYISTTRFKNILSKLQKEIK